MRREEGSPRGGSDTFFGDPGDAALLEVASPVADNSGPHMFFFNAACTRVGDSVFLPLTVNGIEFL